MASLKMIEIQSFKHIKNPTITNPIENIVGGSCLRKHHRRKGRGGVEPINKWSKPQQSSQLCIWYLTIPCPHLVHFSLLPLGGGSRKVDSFCRGYSELDDIVRIE
jgi:hypothetical protein